MEKEIWKDIEGYEGLYQVSNLGNVRSVSLRGKGIGKGCSRQGKLLKPALSAGYSFVTLFRDGKGTKCLIHRLVAKAFIPNPNNLPCVNHKSEIRTENFVENLEWCTYKYNNNYREKGKRISESKKNINSRGGNIPAKKVACYTKDGELVEIFDSMYDAKRKYNYSPASIYNAINNKVLSDVRGNKYTCHTAYSYYWKYVS